MHHVRYGMRITSPRIYASRALELMHHVAYSALLSRRLHSTPEYHLVQRSLLCTWLCELYLQALSEEGSADSVEAIAAEFRAFLGAWWAHLDRELTYSLLEAHGRDSELEHYARACADWKRLLPLLLRARRPAEALAQLRSLVARARAPVAACGGSWGVAAEQTEVEQLHFLRMVKGM